MSELYICPMRRGSLYIVWRGLLFIIQPWAVQSLNMIIFNSFHAFQFLIVSEGNRVHKTIYNYESDIRKQLLLLSFK